MFVNYSYENVEVKDLNPRSTIRAILRGQSAARRLAAHRQGGKRTISKIGPSYVYNTVDNPIFPTTGRRYTLSFDVAGIGGNTNFINPRAEAHLVFPADQADVVRVPGGWEYIRPYGAHDGAADLPEDLPRWRIQHPRLRHPLGRRRATEISGVPIGGNKSLLFNAEYLIHIAGPVRLVLFFDAGQVRDIGEHFALERADHRAVPAGHAVCRRSSTRSV